MPPPKVLVIDDEEPVREAVSDILELIDITTVAAADGRRGVELFREQRAAIGLVLLDLKMPGMSGEETLAALQAVNPNVRVILSSGLPEREVARDFAGKGIAAFLQKPYDIPTLLARVQAVLAGTDS